MRENNRRTLTDVIGWVRADMRADPVLKYIFILTVALTGFFIWYSVPNFTRPDEFSRLIDAMVPANYVLADPSFQALRRGITHGRTFGASFYLSAVALIPGYLIAFATGQLDVLVSANTLRSRWEVWQTIPEWFWTTSLLTGRIFVVLFALGCVYLTYRIGVTMRDRTAGRLAGLLLALSFSFLRSSHEFAEDIPALFFSLLGFYLALYYIKTGDKTPFLAGCGASGLAIAFKLTAGVSVFVLGLAYFLRARIARNDDTNTHAALTRPSLLIGGLVLGVGAIIVGFPSVLVAGLDQLVERVLQSTTEKATVARHGSTPILHQFIRYYAGGLGIPLAVAAGGGVIASVPQLRKQGAEAQGMALALTALSVYLFAFSQWEYVQPHHLLATFPLLIVLTAVAFSRLNTRWPLLARPLIAILIITSGLYASVGVLGYAAVAQDTPEQWITTQVPANATMDVYVPRFQTTAVVHGRAVGHYVSPKIDTYDRLKGVGWNPRGFAEWRHNLTKRDPEYIQFPGYGWRYVPPTAGERYTVVAKFKQNWPFRQSIGRLGGKYSYPEFLPGRRIIVMERIGHDD